MKLVLNKCYGGFSISDSAKEQLRIPSNYPYRGHAKGLETRFHEDIAALIEKYGESEISGRFAKLEVYELPDTVTDWEIDENDGYERLFYVENGKIRHL